MMTLHLTVNRAFFTKLGMSKSQYACAEHMASFKSVTSLGIKRPYCLVGMPKMRREQRYSINCVFGTDYKRKKHW